MPILLCVGDVIRIFIIRFGLISYEYCTRTQTVTENTDGSRQNDSGSRALNENILSIIRGSI